MFSQWVENLFYVEVSLFVFITQSVTRDYRDNLLTAPSWHKLHVDLNVSPDKSCALLFLVNPRIELIFLHHTSVGSAAVLCESIKQGLGLDDVTNFRQRQKYVHAYKPSDLAVTHCNCQLGCVDFSIIDNLRDNGLNFRQCVQAM